MVFCAFYQRTHICVFAVVHCLCLYASVCVCMCVWVCLPYQFRSVLISIHFVCLMYNIYFIRIQCFYCTCLFGSCFYLVQLLHIYCFYFSFLQAPLYEDCRPSARLVIMSMLCRWISMHIKIRATVLSWNLFFWQITMISTYETPSVSKNMIIVIKLHWFGRVRYPLTRYTIYMCTATGWTYHTIKASSSPQCLHKYFIVSQWWMFVSAAFSWNWNKIKIWYTPLCISPYTWICVCLCKWKRVT